IKMQVGSNRIKQQIEITDVETLKVVDTSGYCRSRIAGRGICANKVGADGRKLFWALGLFWPPSRESSIWFVSLTRNFSSLFPELCRFRPISWMTQVFPYQPNPQVMRRAT